MSVEQRVLVLELVLSLLRSSLSALQTMGPDFVFGYIQIVDGEKDPRCLMLVFTATPIVARSFDVERFAEDLYAPVLPPPFPTCILIQPFHSPTSPPHPAHETVRSHPLPCTHPTSDRSLLLGWHNDEPSKFDKHMSQTVCADDLHV